MAGRARAALGRVYEKASARKAYPSPTEYPGRRLSWTVGMKKLNTDEGVLTPETVIILRVCCMVIHRFSLLMEPVLP